ncbi:MAG: glycosyltransferase family 9 protein [Magnetovibrio sp.]|nr:glycosyltransferase family 9 protein [Magnetovibrio sp.]
MGPLSSNGKRGWEILHPHAYKEAYKGQRLGPCDSVPCGSVPRYFEDFEDSGEALARILFITSNRLGDAVLSTGVLAQLLDDYPGARVTVVCGPVPAGLFKGVPGLEAIVELPKQKHSLHWWKMWRHCVLTLWDVVVDLRNAPLSYILPSKRQIHLGRAGKLDVHRVKAMASILKRQDNPPVPKLWTLPQNVQDAEKLMPGEGPILAIGPTANWSGKTWPPKRFAQLALRLTSKDGILPGARIAVIAHSSEANLAAPVIEALPSDRLLNLVGDTPLLSLYACLGRASFYVGNDSGLMHMAAVSNTPTMGLFGPSRENHYAPRGAACRAVRGPKSYDDVFPENYDYKNAPCMMLDLSVDGAEAAAHKLWNEVT